MTVSYWRCLFGWMAGLALTASAWAQQLSVDCARPGNWAEQMLCADSGLMESHVRLQRVHDERRRLLDGDAYLDMVSYHHGWLRGREECKAASDLGAQRSCLSNLYLTRIAQLEPKSGPPLAAADRAEPSLLACRGIAPNWVLEFGASSARLRVGDSNAVQVLKGRITQSAAARTTAWKGRAPGDSDDTTAMVLEGNCALEAGGARYSLMARVLMPEGSLLTGCCQRTPVTVVPTPSVPVTIPHMDSQGGEGGLLAPGTAVRLREIDGANVALRRSPRISSGNVLTRVRAGSMGTVEQTAIREGTSWYFVAMQGTALQGWVMGELVEPVVAMATRERVTPVVPDVPATAPVATPMPLSPSERGAHDNTADGYSGPMAPVSRPWWRLVSPHLPVIDACIQQARMRTARIVSVEADGASTRMVYARDGLNTRIACTVRIGQPVKARTLGHKESFPQIGALFTRAPAQPPSATCYRNTRVVDPRTKALLGWMSYLKPGRRCK